MIAAERRPLGVELCENGRLLRLTLDCGQGNVLDRRTIKELHAALREHGGGAHLRAWILEHRGPHFSFGASVAEHAPGEVERMLPAFHALLVTIVRLEVPFLVAARGMCLGGGLEIALLAERIFAAPDARFAQPEIRLGVFAPAGSLLLPRAVGAQRAADLCLSGRTVDADEALRIGLIAEIAEDPCAAARAWTAQHLFPHSAAALRHATAVLRRDLLERFVPALAEVEARYLGELMATRDAREGIAAFLAKRAPVWEDR